MNWLTEKVESPRWLVLLVAALLLSNVVTYVVWG